MRERPISKTALIPVVLFLALFLSVAADLVAQTTSGTITGTILDSSGAAVPSAAITVLNQDTGVARNTVSTSDGVYNVPSLLPGKYTVEARAQGFSPAQVKDVVLNVGSEARVDVQLQVGSTSQTVTVTESVPLVQTTSSEVSAVMDQAAIESVPLNARDVQQLAAIQPGVQYHYGSGYGNRNITVAGDRPVNNRFLQEGVDTTSVYHNSPSNLATNVQLGVEAVKEFKVLTSNLPAEYGEQSGGVVNVLFKSGTNQLHGSGYEYYRNGTFDARNFFDQNAAPPFHRHQFGGSLGGPIIKDKTFFFVNYEGLRQDKGQTYVANVPDANARAGIVACSGTTATNVGGCGTLPAGTLVQLTNAANPNLQTVRDMFFGGANPLYPACNGAVLGGGLCEFRSNPIENNSENYGLAKVDHSFGTKNTLSATYNNDRGWVLTPNSLGNTVNDRINYRQTLTIQDTHIVSANVVNTLRFGVNRIWLNDQKDIASGTTVDPRLLPVHLLVPCAVVCTPPTPGFPSGATTPLPVITVSGGMQTFGQSARAANFDPRWFGFTNGMLTDDVNYLRGKHALQFGAQFKRVYDNLAQYRGNPVGAYTFQNLAQFLRGGPAQTFGVDLVDRPGATYGRSWATNLFAFYGEDTYKMKSNLTLTLGLRWEYVPGPSERYGRMASIYNPTPLTTMTPVLGRLYYGSNKNFAPRVGFNWDPLNHGKTSIRGGFGVFFNEIWDDTFFTGGTAQFPFVFAVTGLNNTMTIPFNQALLDNAVANQSTTGARQTFAGSTELHPHTPTKYGYNLMVQQELPAHLSLLVGYVGAIQRHQGRSTSWQEYFPTAVAAPGQVPTINGAPIPGAAVNPNCVTPGEITCLYWAGAGLQNANVLGNVVGTNGATSATVPFATLCTATIRSNCFNNNNFGNSITDIVFDANSWYNGLQAALERRITSGLFFRFNYTYAVCVNDAIGDRGGGASNGGGNAWTPTSDHAGSRARCAFQATNSANFSLNYDLPLGRMVSSGFAKALIGGWQISSVTVAQSGFPFDVRLGANVARAAPSGNGNSHPDWAPGCNPNNAVNKNNAVNYLNTSCFTVPVAGYLGNMEPLALYGPGTWSTDISLKKNIRLRESMTLQLTGDMFNAFNHTNLAPPDSTNVFTNTGSAAVPTFVPNTTAGQITRTVTDSRQFQVGARFQF